MKKVIKYFKEWDKWRKRNMNGRFYKFFVLIRLTKSPTFEVHRQFREMKWWEAFENNRERNRLRNAEK